ncbi:MAG: zinc ABC transporter substrate-binding protein, partial [Bdellovibrionota bacterium]
DPRLAILALKNLAERMGTLKPELKPKLKKNLESTTESYSATHKECEKLLKNLRSRTAVSSHDAFGYFENAYNITILAPHGWSTDTEPQPQNVTKIKTWLETKKAGALFLENGVDSPLVQKLSKESGVKIGGNLYADTLTAAEGQAPTYRKMLGWNCKAVSEALR